MDSGEFSSSGNDRRTSKRFDIHAPAIATIGAREIWVETRNVSTTGAYLRMSAAEEEPPSIGDFLDLQVRVPPAATASKPCFICGKGRIIRLEVTVQEDTGIAVEMSDFSIQCALHQASHADWAQEGPPCKLACSSVQDSGHEKNPDRPGFHGADNNQP